MAAKKKTYGLTLYNLLKHEVRVANEGRPEEKQLTPAQQKKLVTSLFSEYKQKPKKAVTKKAIRSSLPAQVSRAYSAHKRATYVNYADLLRDARALNETLSPKKQRSYQELAKLVSEAYTELKGKSWRAAGGKTKLRAALQKQLKKLPAKAPKNKTTYAAAVKEAGDLNALLSEDRRLSHRELLKLVSGKIYPDFKGKTWNPRTRSALRKRIQEELDRLPRRVPCDILELPQDILEEDVNYFDIDTTLMALKEIMPCIYIQVNGGADSFGKTPIFKIDDYEYVSSGVADITAEINKWVRSLGPREKQNVYPQYAPEIQLRPNKKNDGESDSYYLEYMLVIRGIPAEEKPSLTLPQKGAGKKTKKAAQRKKRVKDIFQSKISKLAPQKSLAKPVRKRISKEINDFKILSKNPFVSKQQIADIARVAYEKTKIRLEKLRKNNTLNEGQFKEILKLIQKVYKQK